MFDRKLILIGYSGHAYVVAEAAIESGLEVVGYSEQKPAKKNPFQLNYIGYEQDEKFKGWKQGFGFIPAIGNNVIREKITSVIHEKNEWLASVIHPDAFLTDSCKIGKGTFVSKGVLVNAFSEIGISVILNSGSIIEHECSIGDFSHIAPGVVLAGNVTIGRRSFVGANSVIKEGVTIGDDVIIGAGSVILKDVPDRKKIAGNPGRIL